MGGVALRPPARPTATSSASTWAARASTSRSSSTGSPDVSSEAELEGFPLLMPVVNIHTIGAGGGSLAYAEAGGLRVGPESAGADPGPACYGRGGTRPTVTDANLVLGRVDEATSRAVTMTLDARAPRATRSRALGERARPGRRARARRGHLRRGQRQDGAGDPHADRREGHRAARLRARRLRRRRPDARRLPRPGARHPRGARPALPRRLLRLGDARDARSARTPAAPTSRPLAELDRDDLARLLDELEEEGFAAPGRRGHHARDGPRRARARPALRRPGVLADRSRSRAPASRCEADFAAALSGRFHEAHETRFGHANPGAPDRGRRRPRRRRSGDLGRAEPTARTRSPTAPVSGPRPAAVTFGRRAARRDDRAARRPAPRRRGRRPGRHQRADRDDGRAARARARPSTSSGRSS